MFFSSYPSSLNILSSFGIDIPYFPPPIFFYTKYNQTTDYSFSVYSSGLFPFWCNISQCWILYLNSSLYSICFLSVGFQFRFRFIEFHLLNEVAVFTDTFACVFFCISPQSYFSVVFIVSHPRVFPTTVFFVCLKVFLFKEFLPPFFHSIQNFIYWVTFSNISSRSLHSIYFRLSDFPISFVFHILCDTHYFSDPHFQPICIVFKCVFTCINIYVSSAYFLFSALILSRCSLPSVYISTTDHFLILRIVAYFCLQMILP